MCTNTLVEQKTTQLDQFIDSLEEKDGNLITILHKAQQIFGYLPRDVQLHVSRKLGIPAAKVSGVVSFYSYFTDEPRGKHVVNVCMGTACYVRGAETLMKKIEEKLGIKAGETTEDGKFSIDALRCVGACGLAPVVIVDGKVHGRITEDQVLKLLEI
ncbi:MAG TPA: NAD(P)H-dependent oxidoreductase subunit E [Clostridia bacterium]